MWFGLGATKGRETQGANGVTDPKVDDTRVRLEGAFRTIGDLNNWTDPFGRNNKMDHQVRFFDSEQRPIDSLEARQQLAGGRAVNVYRLRFEKTGEYKVNPGQVGWHIRTQSYWADHGTALKSNADFLRWWDLVGREWTDSARRLS